MEAGLQVQTPIPLAEFWARVRDPWPEQARQESMVVGWGTEPSGTTLCSRCVICHTLKAKNIWQSSCDDLMRTPNIMRGDSHHSSHSRRHTKKQPYLLKVSRHTG